MNPCMYAPYVGFDGQELPTWNTFIMYRDAFSAEECAFIRTVCERFAQQEATVSTENKIDEVIRKNKLRWVPYLTADRDITWLYRKLAHFGARANDTYRFDLLGMLESLQFTEYIETGNHYAFHMDFGNGSMSRRKLSMVLQLSDPAEYEGGELQLLDGNTPQTVEKGLGHIVLFPSFTLHRVTPLQSGHRITLVSWINGYTSYR